MTSFSVVIPAYNEESGIAAIVWRVLGIVAPLKEMGIDDFELLVVDDGSSDQTAEIMTEISGENDRVRLICHPVNRGYGAALKTGFYQARGEFIGFLDADGTYPPEHFPALCEEALNGADLVIGSRMAGADSQMPKTRRVGNIFFATLLSLLANQRVTDSASGMRVFRKDLLQRIYPLPDGLNLTPVMSTRAIHEGVQVVEVPIPYQERIGRSKLSVFRDGSTFLHSMVWTALTYNPVRILGIIGLAGMLISLIIFLAILVMRLSGITSLGPWGVTALFTAVVFGFAGLSIFSLGIVFNYLVSLFYNVPIRQGLIGRPIIDFPIEDHFWWLGGLSLIAGIVLGIVGLVLGSNGWAIERLWLYLLASAMLILTGIQLIIYWIQIRVLEELSQREGLIERDLSNTGMVQT